MLIFVHGVAGFAAAFVNVIYNSFVIQLIFSVAVAGVVAAALYHLIDQHARANAFPSDEPTVTVILQSAISTRHKTSSWGKDLNNIPDWRRAKRSHINAPPISAPRINFISESEPIRMTISTKESGKRDTGSSESTPGLPEVKTLFDDCETGDERKMVKLHKKSPELPSHNSNKGLLEYRNTDYFSATKPGLLDGKGEFECHKYTRSIEGADNKSVLYQAHRLDKSSNLEQTHELNTYEIDYGDEKEHEIKKKDSIE